MPTAGRLSELLIIYVNTIRFSQVHMRGDLLIGTLTCVGVPSMRTLSAQSGVKCSGAGGSRAVGGASAREELEAQGTFSLIRVFAG